MTAKRLEGRDKAILDPALPIIDAHQHLFDRPTLRYMFALLEKTGIAKQ